MAKQGTVESVVIGIGDAIVGAITGGPPKSGSKSKDNDKKKK